MGQGTGRIREGIVALNVRRDGKLVQTFDANPNGVVYNTTPALVDGKVASGPAQFSATPGTLQEKAESLREQGYSVTAYTAQDLSKRRKQIRKNLFGGSGV